MLLKSLVQILLFSENDKIILNKLLKKYWNFFLQNFELIVWIITVIILFFLPETPGQSLCVFKAIGLNSCLGCGIGTSMHHALHFKFTQSFIDHPLGIFGVLIIFMRIIKLIPSKKTNHAS